MQFESGRGKYQGFPIRQRHARKHNVEFQERVLCHVQGLVLQDWKGPAYSGAHVEARGKKAPVYDYLRLIRQSSEFFTQPVQSSRWDLQAQTEQEIHDTHIAFDLHEIKKLRSKIDYLDPRFQSIKSKKLFAAKPFL